MKRFMILSSLFIIPLFAENPTILHVNGTGKVWIKASLADIRLGVEVEGKNSASVQNELSRLLNNLISHLKKASPQKLEIASFSVHPEYNDQSPRQIKGYRGEGEITVTTLSEKAGEMIALAMDAGATKVNGLDLRASREEIMQANKSAIKEACSEALNSAAAAFEALGLESDEIVDVNLNPQEPVFRPFRAAVAFNAMEKGSVGPQVEGEQVVQADVGLQIRFKTKN